MILAKQSLTGGLPTELYAVPNGKKAILHLNVANRAATAPLVTLHVRNGAGAPTADDVLEASTRLKPVGVATGHVLERTGLLLGAGDRVWVTADIAGVTAIVMGLVEDA